ncbi:MAG: hypothetical protein CL522_04765 [Actinobacteria bacterium]|nr:hypothetical protein [Actinomycetota bacterium]|tara:strand:+ start:3102 stop:3887 length:786 start_codon:yes stop_codon:yes gene_type:complete
MITRAEFAIDLVGNLTKSITSGEHRTDIRVLTLKCENIHELKRLVVSSGVARRAEALKRLATSSKEIKISSGAGSFLTAELSSAQYIMKTGITSQRDQFAEWPSGIFNIDLGRQQINGELLLSPGDIFLETDHILSNPIHLEIESGNLVEILGDSADANLMRIHLENEPNVDTAYQLNGISLGLALTRELQHDGLSGQELLQMGLDIHHAGWSSVNIGGSMTLTLKEATVLFDDQMIFESGELTGVLQPDPYEKSAAGIKS